MNTLDIVKKAYDAWEAKDIEALRPLLHNDYKAKMPGGMEINGIEGAKECIEACPMESHSENEEYITEGDKVIRIWDMVTTKPSEFRMRMAELNIVKDGKVLFNEAFFDTKQMPKEFDEKSEEMKKKFQQKTPATAGGEKK